ncbi:MAG: DUF3180 domain-containing protein [Propionibacteriaceae bacterium]|nr:DUF3180 domain-containing protein [Propionibacteriaceae bacterium]
MTRRPGLAPTTGRQIVVAALAGAVVGWMILGVFDLLNVFPPVVPWTVPTLLLLLAAAAFVYARALPKRLEQRRVPSEEAVRAMVMAKSLIMTGALLAGGHAVYVGRWLSLMAAELPAARVWNGAVTIVTAVICVLAGWLLERACMIDGDGDDTEPGEEREAPEAA